MMQHVISYENVLALILLGFNEECAYLYTAGGLSVENVVDANGFPTIKTNSAIVTDNANNRCAPTYAQVSDWLYEEHGIKVDTINFFNVENYNKFILWVNIPNENKKREIVSNGFWFSRIDAHNEAITFSINIIPSAAPIVIPGIIDGPSDGSGDPKDGSGDPKDGSGDPKDGSGDPKDGSGDPKDGSGDPKDGSGDPKDGSGDPKIPDNPGGVVFL